MRTVDSDMPSAQAICFGEYERDSSSTISRWRCDSTGVIESGPRTESMTSIFPLMAALLGSAAQRGSNSVCMTWRNDAISSIWHVRINSPSALYTLRVSIVVFPVPERLSPSLFFASSIGGLSKKMQAIKIARTSRGRRRTREAANARRPGTGAGSPGGIDGEGVRRGVVPSERPSPAASPRRPVSRSTRTRPWRRPARRAGAGWERCGCCCRAGPACRGR